MLPDLAPLFHVVFFALGFVPAIIVGAVISVFVAIPAWAVVLFAIAIGGAVDAFMFWRDR